MRYLIWLLVALWATAVGAETVCAPRGQITRVLKDNGERPRFLMVANPRLVIEVWTGDHTWSITTTNPKRWTCIVATGGEWTDLSPWIEGYDG